jgi:uncharacterized protein (TIGR02996 family)
VHDDETFLAMLAADPSDRGTLVVYADWLEGTGELVRADVLRRIDTFDRLAPDDPERFDRAQQMIDVALRAPRAWLARLAVLARPPLAGSVWHGATGHMMVMRFLAGGALNYTQTDATYQNGTWLQLGCVVAMETNRHFADYLGVISGERIDGLARNIMHERWGWTAQRSYDPDEAAIPDGVIATVFDEHARRRKW